MPKYFNTQPNPVLYNKDGQTADGLSWFESDETDALKAALNRRDVFKVDSKGDFVYDSNDNSEQDDPAQSSEPTARKTSRSSEKNSEG